MNTTIALLSIIPFIIGILFIFRSQREKRYLDDNDTMEGMIGEYKRLGKRLYPIVTYIDNGEEKTIRQGGVTNLKMIKVGTKIRVANIGNGKLLTDYSVKLSTYYAIAFFIAGVLILLASMIA